MSPLKITDLLSRSSFWRYPPDDDPWWVRRRNWAAPISLFFFVLSFITLAGCSKERLEDPGCSQAARALHEAAQSIRAWHREEQDLKRNSVDKLYQGLSYINYSIEDLRKCALSTESEDHIEMIVQLQWSSNVLEVFLERMESSGNADGFSSEFLTIADRASTYAEKLNMSYPDDKGI